MSRDFTCPVSCLHGVADSFGPDYEFAIQEITGNPVILDIGANCGAYSLRCLEMFPKAVIHAYEPNPVTFEYLRKNCEPRVLCHNQAVGDPGLSKLFHGKKTPLCCSQYNMEEQTDEFATIEVIEPDFLPEASIVKIDAEGAESYILERMTFVPLLLVLEWHRDKNRILVENCMYGKMQLVDSKHFGSGRGILKYARL